MNEVTHLLETLTATAGSTWLMVGRKRVLLKDADAPTVARWYADRLREFAANGAGK